MRWLLDTSVCVEVLRNRPASAERLARRAPAEVAVSTVTLAELWHGALRSREARRVRAAIDAFVAPFDVLPFDAAAAEAHAAARHALERAGLPIGERDLVIAATGIAHGLGVITANAREFARIPGLVIEHWG
ncbi:MAG: type II toxin-antitoxin system VapC family toxin [Gemmatimonadales bacterium]|jgi:tRNA(fMet)-specific endonuclease VapC|nr:type II toxin-antitoxin system VapC family toxin [Gemmatimonadales bacterium]